MIAIVGATGQVGRELTLMCEDQGLSFRAFSRSEWDVTNPDACLALVSQHSPKVVVNCSAYTAVDKAESEPGQAAKVNSEGPANLTAACVASKVFLIHISTDYVFADSQSERPGSPWRIADVPKPVGVYAESKFAGEEAIRKIAKENALELADCAAIIRTSWVYSSFGANFVKGMLRLMSNPEPAELRIVEDQIGRPTYARTLAEFILRLINEKNRGGLFHFSNSGVASWYDFAVAIFEIAREKGLLTTTKPVHPIESKDFPTPAPRPPYTVLDLSSARSVMPVIPHWREDLDSMLSVLAEEQEGENDKT